MSEAHLRPGEHCRADPHFGTERLHQTHRSIGDSRVLLLPVDPFVHAPRAIDNEVDVGRIGGYAEKRISAEPFGIGGRRSRVVRAPRLPRRGHSDTAVATSTEVLEHGRMAVSRAPAEPCAREEEKSEAESRGRQRLSLEASTRLTLSLFDPALVRAPASILPRCVGDTFPMKTGHGHGHGHGRTNLRIWGHALVRRLQGRHARGRATIKPPLALVSRRLNRGVAREERIGSNEAPHQERVEERCVLLELETLRRPLPSIGGGGRGARPLSIAHGIHVPRWRNETTAIPPSRLEPRRAYG